MPGFRLVLVVEAKHQERAETADLAIDGLDLFGHRRGRADDPVVTRAIFHGDVAVRRRVRFPWRGMMLADPGFLIAELIEPSQRLKVPVVALFLSALRRMRGHGEIADFHGVSSRRFCLKDASYRAPGKHSTRRAFKHGVCVSSWPGRSRPL